MARMFLIDGSNHAFRVHFALPPRHASDGTPTRVLYGFSLLLQKLLRTWKPDYVAVSFDIGKTFRHDMFPDYKGHRPDMPDDLRQQWPLLPDLVRAFGYACINVKGFEADDVIGTLAKRFGADDLEVLMVTGDKDYMQLIDENIQILDDRKGETIGIDGVEAKFGVTPDKVVDVLGLAGDSSDNIPGIFKVGPKTATKYVNMYGDVEGVIAAAQEGKIKGKTGQRIADEAENARISKVLATIRTDVPIPETLDDLKPKDMDVDTLRGLFDKWEFGQVARKLLPSTSSIETDNYSEVSLEELPDFVAGLSDASISLGVEDGRLLGIGIAPKGQTPRWVTLPGATLLGPDPALAILKPWLEDAMRPKTIHGLKAAMRLLSREDVQLAGVTDDVLLLDYVLASHRRNHGLEDLAARHLGHTMARRSRKGLKGEARYATERAHVTALLFEKLVAQLDDGMRSVYRDIELPLVPVLAQMEESGILLDREALSVIDQDIRGRVTTLAEACQELAGKPFNVRSRHELREILFEDLGLPPSKKVKDGWSTASSVLEKLVDLHPLPAKILEYRKMDKLRSTYLSKLPGYVAEDGRIHTSFNQAVAATGRLSSNDPNLQNIPIRTFEGRRIRTAFVPKPGCVFLSADYSQVELRVLADLSEDELLETGFKAGDDIHARTASEVFGVPRDQVDVSLRSAAKAINFGLLYGMSAFRLAGDLQISREQAQKYMDSYFERMPRVRDWIESTKEAARASGMVTTRFGRRRLIPELHAAQYNERMAGEREAVNTCIQGTAADIIKLAMLAVSDALVEGGFSARMILQVHDELLLEVPETEVDQVTELVRREMENVVNLAVPLVVNTSIGHNWNEAHG